MLSFLVFNLICVSSGSELPCNYWLCPENHINNTYCNKYCMNQGCNYDSAFYSDDKYLVFERSDCFSKCECDAEKLTNGRCDPECNSYECGFDLGDCGYCDSGCFIEDLQSDICKKECSKDLCYEIGSNPCAFNCAPGCSNFIDLLSVIRKEECCSESCRNQSPSDFTDLCSIFYCAPQCTYSSIGDGKCQGKCYNSECDYDGGDCDCSPGCKYPSSKCTTNTTYTDPCDTESCNYKNGICGYCASNCYKENLGDGICQSECNTESCNYDNGDCGCGRNCSFKYDSSISNYIQTGESDECSTYCLVLDCRFGIDFCTDESLVKSAVLNFLVYKDREKTLNMSECTENYCTNTELTNFLTETDKCLKENPCNKKECFYCMGQAENEVENCLRQSFDECILCDSTMIEGVCYKEISVCPNGYENIPKLTEMFGNSLWCLKEATHYSTSSYKEIFVNSLVEANGEGSIFSPVKTLYNALVNIYAEYTKIFLVNKEIEFFIDDSYSAFVSDKYDPLNILTAYKIEELRIIGNYSETEKTIIYWKDNLKITPLAQRFYLQNIEFVGKYVLNNACDRESCYYCPNIVLLNNMYTDDNFFVVKESNYVQYYSKNCSSYSSVNVFNFAKEVYVENVIFKEFRYQYNSFIKSKSILNLKNVEFSKMQAKSDGSVILIDCTDACINSSFTYKEGLVSDIGAGYNDIESVKVGSFFKSYNVGHIYIGNVTFSFNFIFYNIKSSSLSYLLYSKNHLGTITIESCQFYANYVNYLLYIDVKSLLYTEYRPDKGVSLAHSQQHFYMNDIQIISTYCSHGLVHYYMENVNHNIKITNLSINESVLGNNGVLKFEFTGNLVLSDINGGFELISDEKGYFGTYIFIEGKYLILENISVDSSLLGKNAIYVETFNNVIIKNVFISNIKDYSIIFGHFTEIYNIVNLFKINDSSRHFNQVNFDYLNRGIFLKEMIIIINSMNLLIDSLSISKIVAFGHVPTMGLSIENTFWTTKISKLYISELSGFSPSAIALSMFKLNIVYLNDFIIYNVTNSLESIVEIKTCYQVIIESGKIQNVISSYSSGFSVSDSHMLTISNFLFQNMTSQYNNGGCLNLITEDSNFIIKIQSVNFTGCFSSILKGGAIYLESLNTRIPTSLQMYDVQISECYSDEGSAIFISYNVNFDILEESKLVRLMIFDNECKSGGTISDNHFFGKLQIEGLEMFNNNQGFYVSYSSENLEFHIINSKIYAPSTLNSVFFLFSSVFGSSIYFQNVDIISTNKVAIEAYNLKIFIDQMNITDTFQAFSFNNNLECEANKLRITNSKNEAITLDIGCSLFCNDCEFTQNKNSIILAGTYSKFSLLNSQIFSNTLNNGNFITLTSKDAQESTLINCQIYSNSLISGSLIYITSSFLTIKNSSIIGNQGYSIYIQSIYLSNSNIEIFNSRLQFNTLVEYGAFFYAAAESSVTAKDSVFENSQSKIGNIYGKNVEININNCSFSGNTGGDIYTTESNLIILNSKFEKSLQNRKYSGIIESISNSLTIIEGTVFFGTSKKQNLDGLAYVYDEFSKQLEILNSTFLGSSDFIKAVYIREILSVSIENSNFIGFKTNDYSALTLISSAKGNNITIANSKIFKNLSTKNGGGVYIDSYNVVIENTEISFNYAQDSGGGIYYISPNCNNCGIYLLAHTKIINNSCTNDGGAIKWKDYKPFIESSVLINNNSAAYGADLASIPSKFALKQMRVLSDPIIFTLSSIPPGKKFDDFIEVSILDTYGQVVETENSITATLMVNETEDLLIAVSGITTFQAKNGVLNITSFILTGEPGSNAYLKLKSDSMMSQSVRNDNSEYSDSVFIKAEFRNCTKGEQIQAISCVDCNAGMYTLEAARSCLECPTGAICPGGSGIIVKNGYWRSSLESSVVYVCDIFDACIKGNLDNELGNCSVGYSGVLCKSCELGYSKTASGICTKCPDNKTNLVYIIFLFLLILFLCFLLVKTTLTSAFSPKSLHSIYIKIFTNYLQLVFVVNQLDLDWPPYFIEFFNIQRATASVTDQLISLDCYISLRNSGDVKSIYYNKLFMVAALPIVIFVISFIYWIFHGSITETYKYLKREVYSTIIVLFFLVYPTIVKTMFSNFSCIKIDKMQSYLNENTLIQCWDYNHKKFSLIVALPSIFLWTIGVPTILFLLMKKNRRRLYQNHYRVVYGFLYNGYKQRRYYWEILIMYRKIILITIIVFNVSQARAPKALNFILVILVFIYIHHIYKPYNLIELNNMEMQALSISGLTIYFGLYYLSKGISNEIKIILFCIIILGNCFFVIYWIFYMSKALVDIFIKIFPRFRSIFKRGDAFDEEFHVEEVVRTGIYFNQLEGKMAYTFINIEKEVENGRFRYRNIEDVYADIAKRDIERLK